MVYQYFAHYLLNQGKLTPSQLHEALEYERSVRVKLGTMAIHAGLLTAGQVEEIHGQQRTHDKRFGVLAIELGYLTEKQLGELLSAQGKETLTFIQAVTDKGFLTLTELENSLADYLEKMGMSREEWGLYSNNQEQLVRKLVDFSAAGKRSETLYRYLDLLLRNMVRFLNERPILALPAWQYEQPADWVATQGFSGALDMHAGLAMNEDVLLKAASRFYGEPIATLDDLALDSIGEFLNVHHGVFCATLANAGFEADLLPQSVQKNPGWHDYSFRIPLATSFGQMDLVLSLPD